MARLRISGNACPCSRRELHQPSRVDHNRRATWHRCFQLAGSDGPLLAASGFFSAFPSFSFLAFLAFLAFFCTRCTLGLGLKGWGEGEGEGEG